MKKLHLKVDTLKVESFPTAAAGEQRGTVAGLQWYGPTLLTYCQACGSDDPGQPTWWVTCYGQKTCIMTE